MKVYCGDIITVDKNNSVYRYLVEDNGIIVYVGDELPEEYRECPVTNIPAMIPSFADTHQHFASFSIFHAGLNVMDACSNSEIKDMIKDFTERCSDSTLICFGASPHSVKERRLISRSELDEVCPDRELMVVKYDGHACIINSKLLKKLAGKIKKLRGYHPDTGEMNQEAFFACSDYISGAVSIPKLVEDMYDAVDYYASKGIGEIHTVSGVGFPLDADITIEKNFAKALDNGFQIRVFPQSMKTGTATSRHIPRIGGCFECALDGCFGSHDAAMLLPYDDSADDRGVLYYSDEKVTEFCKKANRLGLQIEMHAIGDRAFDQAARALKAALDDFPREDHRHGIIHDCLPTEEGIRICSEYKIQMPVQSAFIAWKQEPDEYLEKIMGKERTSRLNPLSTFLKNGIDVSFGSDAPCTDPDPIMWIDRAVNHTTENERIDIKDALRMATYNGYKACFDEKERGSLEVGKIADMAVISDNPYEIEADDIKNLEVEKLFLSGKEYHSCKKNLSRTVKDAIKSNNKF